MVLSEVVFQYLSNCSTGNILRNIIVWKVLPYLDDLCPLVQPSCLETPPKLSNVWYETFNLFVCRIPFVHANIALKYLEIKDTARILRVAKIVIPFRSTLSSTLYPNVFPRVILLSFLYITRYHIHCWKVTLVARASMKHEKISLPQQITRRKFWFHFLYKFSYKKSQITSIKFEIIFKN